MQKPLLFCAPGPVAGIDEAGRGPLAGPVVAAAVILRDDDPIDGLADSKLLSARRRSELAVQITARSLAWSVAWADPAEIDRLNILQATLLAMRRAILGLRITPAHVEVDGNALPNLQFHDRLIEGTAIVGGDAKVAAISAASIIAKVRRDRIMQDMDCLYPQYGFRRHKGYATADHRSRLAEFGPCREHRRSFAPISRMQSGSD
jgi:ribonuclease HII